MISPGDILNQRYRIVRTLGQGGFSTVYRAWDTTLGRPCALKENPDSNPQVQRQFLREAKLLANLHHTNLPRVSDYFIENGMQYLVMDFVDGQDLQEMLEDRGAPLPEDAVIPWVLQVCDALAYLHSQKPPIIHRDIKPGNIKITPDGIAMLVDFGIAKQEPAHKKTTIAAQAVTPGFSPYEQYGKGSTDARTDIYALGATLYTLLTAQEPPESVQRVVRDPLIPARTHNPAISLRTGAALQRALQMDPQQRFPNALDFKAALAPPAPARASGRIVSPARPPASSSLTVAGALPAPPASAAPSLPPLPWGRLAGVGLIVLLIMLVGLLLRSQSAAPLPSPAADLTGRPLAAAPSQPITPGQSSVQALGATPTITSTMLAPAQITPTAPVSLMRYTVQIGDTCSQIAERFGLSVRALAGLNHLPSDCGVIYAGQVLWVPAPDPQAVPTLTPTAIRPVATTVSEVDGAVLLYVPSGEFPMGTLADDLSGGDEEKPQHEVYLKAYWIDRTEVTNAMYARCVQVGLCRPPAQNDSASRPAYFDEAEFAAYPVVYVSWQDAVDYCQWAGRRLPSEAEWEKAARGTDARPYPWGDSAPDLNRANFGGRLGDTAPVGSYPAGASPFGALDMAGNAAEWTADWFSKAAYSLSQYSNPSGPATGEFRVLRGGSWFNQASALRASFRLWNYPELRSDTIGFRCAR